MQEECEAGGSAIAQVLAARADVLHAKLPFRAAQEGSALAAAVASRMAADAESLLASAQAGERPQDVSGETGTDTRGQAAGSASGVRIVFLSLSCLSFGTRAHQLDGITVLMYG